MTAKVPTILSILLIMSITRTILCKKHFPKDFIFGAASSAYQVEGAWNVSDKGLSIWDVFTHTSGAILDGSTGDTSADSFHLYHKDVDALKELGAKMYRFSISWPRIMPDGYSNKISKDGTQYYNNLIDKLIENGIEPMVTLYHWDMPEKLQKIGGLMNQKIVDLYVDYARYCFNTFGDRVKYWLTFNEPVFSCTTHYGFTLGAPALDLPGTAEYICVHNILLAHAYTYQMYGKEFRSIQKGQISLSNMGYGYYPISDSVEDINATLLGQDLTSGWIWNPIFTEKGDYPQAMKERIASKSLQQGYSRSRLPEFTPYEIDLLKGSADFLGLNYYSTVVFSFKPIIDEIPFYTISVLDFELNAYAFEEWRSQVYSFYNFNTEGFRLLLRYFKKKYNNPPIFLTEIGSPMPGNDTSLNDFSNVDFINQHMSTLMVSLSVDKVDVKGCLMWSLIDCFEWSQGYTVKFGLYEVDFSSPTKERTGKLSSRVYKNIIETKTVDYKYMPIIKTSHRPNH